MFSFACSPVWLVAFLSAAFKSGTPAVSIPTANAVAPGDCDDDEDTLFHSLYALGHSAILNVGAVCLGANCWDLCTYTSGFLNTNSQGR